MLLMIITAFFTLFIAFTLPPLFLISLYLSFGMLYYRRKKERNLQKFVRCRVHGLVTKKLSELHEDAL
jgi:hypothetical protein